MVILKFLNLNHENELKKFYIDLRNQTDTFRYFDKREYSIIKNHLITIGAFDNDELVGYGHLENFNNYNWLGIASS